MAQERENSKSEDRGRLLNQVLWRHLQVQIECVDTAQGTLIDSGAMKVEQITIAGTASFASSSSFKYKMVVTEAVVAEYRHYRALSSDCKASEFYGKQCALVAPLYCTRSVYTKSEVKNQGVECREVVAARREAKYDQTWPNITYSRYPHKE